MIRLIASDMDGSLLDSQKRIPDGFFELLDELEQKEITFVAASGRSYPKMELDFHRALEQLYFICDNGALIMHRDKILHMECMDAKALHTVYDAFAAIPDILPVLCGTQGAWHLPCPERFVKHLTSYYIHDHVVTDLHEVTDDIFKIAICDLKGSAENSFAALNPQFGEQFSLVVSGENWMDIMNKGVNKGKSLQYLQDKLGVSRAETMAFGDFYNDVELLQRAQYSYVMANANEDMRQFGRYLAPSNEENGVMRVIREMVLGR